MTSLTLETLREMQRKLDAISPIPPRLKFISNPSLTIGPFEDWSLVRSPGRAARRRKQGHLQRITSYYLPDPKLYQIGDTIVGHPETLRHLEAKLEARTEKHGLGRPAWMNPW